MREGWEIRKLGDLADLQRGLTYSKGDEVPFSSKRVLRSNNIDLESSKLDLTELKYLRDDFAIPDDRKVKKNSIFICMSNGSKQHVGKVAFIDTDIDYAFGGFMGLIVPKAGIAPKYVFYSCQSSAYRLFLSSIGNGIGITNLRFTDLANYSIPVPPIAEQEKIVAELDCLTGIIEKKKQQLEELDKLAQSIYYDMFGDPITNEKGWVVKCVGEICSLKSGNSNANNSSPGDLPYVKVGDMGIPGNERSITTSSQFVSRDDNKKGIFPIGTTIFPKRGGAIYTNKKRLTSIEICCDLNTMGVIPNKDVLHPLYLFQFFLGLDLGTLCNGAAIPQLNNCDIAPLRIEVPPLDLQSEFARKVEAIDRQKELVKRSIVETETLFNSRMDFWFNN